MVGQIAILLLYHDYQDEISSAIDRIFLFGNFRSCGVAFKAFIFHNVSSFAVYIVIVKSKQCHGLENPFDNYVEIGTICSV